ncbi:MAG: M15 family metallopeptidase [Clostridia bacterium]|nr:M15 family metallopeptidase [Clostridia bacterium]
MKKILMTLMLILAVFTATVNAATYSDWAEEDIMKAQTGGILNSEQMQYDMTQPIKRSDIAMLAVKTYINVRGYKIGDVTSHFTDTKSPYPEAAYRLGILYGTSDTEFSPNDNATRQEMAKIILSLKAVLNDEEVMLPNTPQSEFTDFATMSDWAKPYVAKAAADGIINGYPDGSFGGTVAVSWEQAIALILRCTDLNAMGELPTIEEKPEQEINISGYVGTVSHGETRIKWNSSGTKTVTVTQARNSYYEGDIAPITETYSATGYIDITLNPNRKYTISVDGVSRTFNTAEVAPVGYDAIKATYPTTKEMADPLMVTITVPVWRLSNGNKVSSTATFFVHNAIADKVKLVFEEIYNGPEKFPIRDVGGYAWRGGRSEHNGGTAIDINANENYCIYNNGTVIGKYWKPYEDPYSIKPYGDVVNAFERHGFTWGGDAWRNPKDYMHFSYLGT